MICSKCGNINQLGSTFCVKCGTNLKERQSVKTQTNFMGQTQTVNTTIEQQIKEDKLNTPITNTSVLGAEKQQASNQRQSMVEPTISNRMTVTAADNLQFVSYFIGSILKPISNFKENKSKLNDSKTSLLLGGVIAILMTVFQLITTMLSVVRVEDYSFSKGITHSWEFENLKEIKYFDVIFKGFFTYAVVIAIIALVLYLGGLLLKRKSSYIKMLGITATSILPFALGTFFLAPILGILYSAFSLLCIGVGCIYSIYLFYEFVNVEYNLEGNLKMYFHLGSIATLLVIASFALGKIMTSVTTYGIGSFLG